MPARSRISIAKPDIVRLFRQQSQKIYTLSDIRRILTENSAFWRLTQATTVNKFMAFLLNSTELREVQFEFPHRPVVRFTWGEVDTYSLVQSINFTGYFTHYTAMHFHGLTEQLPKTIYFNQEQRFSGGEGKLSQDGITRAFRGKCRITNNIATFHNQQIYLLNGRNTNQLGVMDFSTGDSTQLRITNMERTLIDATVRPVYSGGVFEVAKAFMRSSEKVSINKLVAMLKQLRFTYPYHQAIGFYLQRAGLYRQSQLDLLRKLPIEYDFYLDYGLKTHDYNADWRLFIPKGF